MRRKKSAAPASRLPAGMRDYLPDAASERRAVAEACLAAFERWGYRRIITPIFEYAETLARGSDTPSIRFVEPVSGEVVALRLDITPQIARLVATRLGELPGPLRLCYEGSVLRLANARGQRELIQAGVELIGAPQPEGDAEVVALAAEAVAAAGVADLTIDLGHMGFLRAALRGVDEAVRDAIAHKDASAVARLTSDKLLNALPRLYGEPREVLRDARRLAKGTLSRALDELSDALGELAILGTKARLTLDLGEVRGFDYYTGVRFAGFAPGHGDALVVGGRYDDLCGRYGRDARATGFAIDVEAACAALESHGAPAGGEMMTGTLVAGTRPLAPRIAANLRAQGQRAACQPDAALREAELLDYAARFRFARVLLCGPRGATFIDRDGTRRKVSPAELRELKGHG